MLNQVLKAGCRRLLDASSSARTQEKLRYCCLLLDDVSDRKVGLEDFERIVLTRQNERFADLLTFCRLVLCGQAPSASSGSTRTFSLLFDMNAVFEAFVAEFVRREVMPAFPDYSIRPQARNDRRYLLGASEGGKNRIALRPDILIKSRAAEGAVAVMDTKWKRVAEPRSKGYATVAPADYYQMVAYAQRYGAQRSVLLFPRADGEEDEDFHILGPDGESTGRQIGVRFLDLNIELTRREHRQRLAARLTQIVTDCLGNTVGAAAAAGSG
jgi:5-methylcytosine-specific restriction enzyme subunit McrC